MEKIITNRGGGKTLQLIKKSAKSGDYIVCRNQSEASRVSAHAIDLGLNIPFPITYDEFLNNKYHHGGISGFLIDNADMLLKSISIVPIRAISLTQ